MHATNKLKPNTHYYLEKSLGEVIISMYDCEFDGYQKFENFNAAMDSSWPQMFSFLELATALTWRNFYIYICSTSVNLSAIKEKLFEKDSISN
jgi:hypothetical protein